MQQNKIKRIALLVLDGVSYRNFILSDFCSILKDNRFSIEIFTTPIFKNTDNKQLLNYKIFPYYSENLLIRLLREAITFARLTINSIKSQNKTILTNWFPDKSNFYKKSFYLVVELLGKILYTEKMILNIEKFLFYSSRRSKSYSKYSKFLSFQEIDILFCTNQRIPYQLPFILAAKDYGINMVTFISSWDNIPKARLAFRSDFYFVWSESMKNELLFFYSEITQNQIKVTGSPQFDFYRKKDFLLDRDTFSRKYNLSPDKKWVLFSGDDRRTSPYDYEYLNDVANALKEQDNIELLFRQVPTEDSTRYNKIIKAHKIRHISPNWRFSKEWSESIPTIEDARLLVNLAYHCKVVINIGSTMALDFAIFNNHALYINYNKCTSKKWRIGTIYKFEHFKTMDSYDSVGWVNSKDEILFKVKEIFDNPDCIARDRVLWLNKVTSLDKIENSSTKIVEVLNTI